MHSDGGNWNPLLVGRCLFEGSNVPRPSAPSMWVFMPLTIRTPGYKPPPPPICNVISSLTVTIQFKLLRASLHNPEALQDMR